jgi:hypothetical protein
MSKGPGKFSKKKKRKAGLSGSIFLSPVWKIENRFPLFFCTFLLHGARKKNTILHYNGAPSAC